MKIIACGTPNRADDEAGLVVADLLRRRGVSVIEHTGDGLTLAGTWSAGDSVILIDAVRAGRPAGTIVVWDAVHESVPVDGHRASSHGFGVAEAIELARTLDCLPARLRIYGIEGAVFDIGAAMSPVVRAACEQVAEQVARLAAQINAPASA